MSTSPLPPCPVCSSNRQVKPLGTVGDMFTWGKCRGTFDNDPDEGGSHDDRRPDARLIREDAARERRRDRVQQFRRS